MILSIDIGNTTVGIGCVERNNEGEYVVRFSGKLETNRHWTEAVYTSALSELLEKSGIECGKFEGAAISSVVPEVLAALQESIRKILGKEAFVITSEHDFGLEIAVDEPVKIGRDRLVDSAWAAANYPLPIVTADLGTATTFNVIKRGGILAGGVIAAGMVTGLLALASRTAQLPKLELKRPDHIIGRNTTECMLSGAVVGTAAILDGVVREIEEELGEPVGFLITGGGAKYVDSLVHHPHIYDPDVMLKGIAMVYGRNSKK